MKLEIEFSRDLDSDLLKHFATVEDAARPYVAKQLIRLALTTNVSPFIKIADDERLPRKRRQVQKHPTDVEVPEFEYTQAQQPTHEKEEKKMKENPTPFQSFEKKPEAEFETKKISKAERIKNLKNKMSKFGD
jgi:hypothetical protein